MGGNPDRTGVVKKEKLIDVIKNEFELTIDLEDLIEKSLTSSADLNYADFCIIFESAGEEIKSKVSLVSVKKNNLFFFTIFIFSHQILVWAVCFSPPLGIF